MSDKLPEERHRCSPGSLPFAGHGEAIDDCSEDENGVFWVGNSEYGTAVFYCPFCGTKAPTDPTTVPRSPYERRHK